MLSNLKFRALLRSLFGAAALMLAAPTLSFAAEYPQDRIKFVIPFAPGGGSDAVGLRIVKAATKYTDIPIDLLYMPGGAGVVGAKHVADADSSVPLPMLVSLAQFITAPPPEAGYTADDFEWIAQIMVMPIGIVAPPDSELTFAEAVEHSKQDPESLSAGVLLGGGAEVVADMIEESAGAKFRRVPHSGVGEIMLGVLGGHMDLGIVSLGAAVEAQAAGSAKLIAISHAERLPNLPDVPTISEVVGSEIVFGLDRAIFAQKGIAPEAKQFLEELFAKVVADPDFIKETTDQGEVPSFYTGEELATYLNDRFTALRPFFETSAN